MTNVTSLKNNKGVSLIMLVIAVIMMIIIVSFAVFSSKNTTPEAKLAAAYTSLKAVKDASTNALMLIEINPDEYDEYDFFGHNIQFNNSDLELNNIKQDCGIATTGEEFSNRTYKIAPATNDEEKRILEKLDLKGITATYIVDLENNKYYILGGVERVDGGTLYEYREIETSYQMLVK